ncbi:sigma factor G inhibitor Gin [Metabacillus sp. 113a]|uniref:sigma factor G inhibitor Gin n=1 Tax=Metabacillus sp. 113a TaxID=3404706 RepID=UPI003CF4F5E3
MNEKRTGVPDGETCIICGVCKPEGIHLYTSFVCNACEAEIVATEPDAPKYDYFVKKLRSVKAPPLYS